MKHILIFLFALISAFSTMSASAQGEIYLCVDDNNEVVESFRAQGTIMEVHYCEGWLYSQDGFLPNSGPFLWIRGPMGTDLLSIGVQFSRIEISESDSVILTTTENQDSGEDEVWLFDLENDVKNVITFLGENPGAPHLSDDGKWVVFVAYGSNMLRIMDTYTLSEYFLEIGEPEDWRYRGVLAVWSMNNAFVVVAGDGTYHYVSFTGHHELAFEGRPVPGRGEYIKAFSSDGRYIAVATGAGVEFYDLRAMSHSFVLRGTTRIYALLVVNDGSVYVAHDEFISLFMGFPDGSERACAEVLSNSSVASMWLEREHVWLQMNNGLQWAFPRECGLFVLPSINA